MATENNNNFAPPLTTSELRDYHANSQHDIRQIATKGVIWTAGQKYGERAISFFVLLILARLLSPSAFGLVALASVFISFAQIFVDQGLGDAVVQTLEVDQRLLNTAFWINLSMGLLMMLFSVAASQRIADLYGESELTLVIRWLSVSFVFSALSSLQQALLRRQLDFKRLALRSLLATFGSGIVAVILAALGAGVWSLVVKMLLYTLISVLTLWGISSWRPSFSFSWESFKRLWAYGIHIVGAQFVDFFNRRSDDMLVGFFLGATILGYYSLAYSLFMIVTELLIVVPNMVVFPVFSRIRQDMTVLRASVYEATHLISLITIPLFVCFSILAPEIVHVLYGPRWAPSIPVVQVLMLVGIVHSAFFFFGSLLKAVGKPQWRFAMLSLTALLNVIGFATVVRWGMTAVAVSYVCVGYLVSPLYLELIRRAIDLDVKIYLKQYVSAFICTIVTGIVVLMTRSALEALLSFYLRLTVVVLCGAASYLFCLFFVARPVFYRGLSLIAGIMPQTPLFLRVSTRGKKEGQRYD